MEAVQKVKNLIPLEWKKRFNEIRYNHKPYVLKGNGHRIMIKCPVPPDAPLDSWGDYHYALSLANALHRLGCYVRVDFLKHWYNGARRPDEAVLVLRGLEKYSPVPWNHNLMWVISHPDMVSQAEIERYDHVWAAGHLSGTETLWQCTDTEKFNLRHRGPYFRKPLFVGNARGYTRQIVRDCITAGIDIDIIGAGYEGTPAEKHVLMKRVPNDKLAIWYASAPVVLNDQHEDMADQGFIPNRIFDATACGAYVVTAPIQGVNLYEMFGGRVREYRCLEELAHFCSAPLNRVYTATTHTFDARAQVIYRKVVELIDSGRPRLLPETI